MPLSFIVSIFGRHCSTWRNKIQDQDKFRIWASTETGDPHLLMLETTVAKQQRASHMGLRVRESRITHIVDMPQ
jgi:hypothetical protein